MTLITGLAESPSGQLLSSGDLRFQASPFTVKAAGVDSHFPNITYVSVEDGGEISFNLLPGRYVGGWRSYGSQWFDFDFQVPDASAASFNECLTGEAPVNQAPAVVVSASIMGNTGSTGVLTLNPGSATGVPAPSYTVSWSFDGAVLPGESGLTLAKAGRVGQFQANVFWSNGIPPAAVSASNVITTAAATAPAAFADSQWTLTSGPGPNEMVLNISALPSNGGSPITALQYQLDGGAWADLTGLGTGPRTLVADLPGTVYSGTVRAVNSVGNGPASTAKTVTSGAIPAPTWTTPLPDVAMVQGAANIVTDLRNYSTGGETFAVQPTGQGVSISGYNMTTSAAALRSGTVTVTASNGGGSASDAFEFAVTAQPVLTASLAPNPPVAGTLLTITFSAAPDSVTATLDGAPVTLSGTGGARTLTPASEGELAISATKAGYTPLSITVEVQPADVPVEPTTITVAGTDFRAGIVGPRNHTATQSQWSAEPTFWVGKIKGTDATLSNIWTYPSSATIGPRVSIDGGPFTVVDVRTMPAVLFSGLADVEHDVVIRAPAAAGNGFWTAADVRPVLNVTGVDPSVRIMPVMAETFDGTFKTASFQIAGPASRTPALVSPTRHAVRGPSLASLAFRGAFTRLGFAVLLNSGAKHNVFVSVDGAAPVKLAGLSQSVAYWTPPAGTHDFIVWGGNLAVDGSLAVLADEPATPLDLPRLHHFGHSIVEGNSAESGSGVTDMMATAARNGMIPANFGIAGNTTPQLLSRLPTVLAGVTVDANDVAVLDIGRNDVTAGSDTLDGQYGDMIDLLLSKGYGAVICMSQMNFGPGINTRFQAVAAGKGESVKWCDRNSYTSISTVDGLHPSDAGYARMNALNVTHFDPLIV